MEFLKQKVIDYSSAKILIVEDDSPSREYLRISFSKLNCQVYSAPDGKTAIQLISKVHPDVIILDLRLPDMSGIDVLKKAKEIDHSVQVIITTGFVDMPTTIQAMKYEAYDYLKKPFDSIILNNTVKKLFKNKRYKEGGTINIEDINTEEQFGADNDLIGNSPQIYELYKKIGRVSSNRVSILIHGESGTGKELVTRVIHESGITNDKPFVAVNCSALTETLLESELFGHEKGSFTGATRNKKGKFELAGEGTIFLDEISEISLNLQVKLLRVIQEKEFERVGGEDVIPIKARIIAATNRNLERLVRDGTFREDLYYRLKVVSIEVPPLRNRKSDIPVLVVHFLKNINSDVKKNVIKIPYEVMELLQNYDWMGNVRELENVLIQGVIMAKGEVLEKDLIILGKAEKTNDNKRSPVFQKSLAEMEKEHIKLVLDEVGWDKLEASKILGIAKTTLYNKIENYGIRKFVSDTA